MTLTAVVNVLKLSVFFMPDVQASSVNITLDGTVYPILLEKTTNVN